MTGEDEALQVANDTQYGLSSAVFTRDKERGLRFALSVQAGMTHVNDHSVDDTSTSPFGGEKNSGGRRRIKLSGLAECRFAPITIALAASHYGMSSCVSATAGIYLFIGLLLLWHASHIKFLTSDK